MKLLQVGQNTMKVEENNSGRVYVTSDLHFNHNQPFIYMARGFSSVEEMNFSLVENWNSLVTEEDTVFILGDLVVGGDDSFEESLGLIRALKGKKILVRGNHDTEKRIAAFRQEGIEVVEGKFLKVGKQNYYLSHFPTICTNIGEEDFSLKRRIINLCGHTHTTDPWAHWDLGLIYHCEVDCNGLKPILIEEIRDRIKEKLKKI